MASWIERWPLPVAPDPNGKGEMGKLAIVGAGGVLGAKLAQGALETTDDEIFAYTHGAVPQIPGRDDRRIHWSPLDLADNGAIAETLEQAHPDAVINAAAMTNVDACETRRDDAFAANGAGPRALAEVATRLEAPLVHVSTDYVFPGDEENPGPYLEGAPPRPVNVYGASKLAGEAAVREVCAGRSRWIVARTALVYGHIPGGRTNFVKWLVGELRAGRRVRIVNDQYNTPTLADDLARALLLLTRSGSTGVIHVAGPELLGRHEWAYAIARHYGLDTGLIDVVSTAELRQPALRPLRSGLRTSRGDELGGAPMRGVLAGLEALEI